MEAVLGMVTLSRPETSRKPLKVFLCHFRADTKQIETSIYNKLRNEEGIKVWYEEEDLLYDQSEKDVPIRVLQKSDVFLLCWSLSSKKKPPDDYVHFQLRKALEFEELLPEKDFIVPILLEDCTKDESIFDRRHAEFYKDEERCYKHLMKTLRSKYNQLNGEL